MKRIQQFLQRHPRLGQFLHKIDKDNVGFLASAIAWTLLTSVVPILVGLVAITGFVLRDPQSRQAVISHLSAALQNVVTPRDIQSVIDISIHHTGLLSIIGIVGIIWGGSNVGGAIATVFQPIFEVSGRPILKEKLIDIVMIVVFAALMIVIILATTASAMVSRLLPDMAITGSTTFLIGTGVSLAAAFLLFATLYLVFPNVEPRFKLINVWPGALLSAVLFQILTYIWPLYASLSHFNRYSAVLAPVLVLTAWIYFFSMILVLGAELVAIRTIREANAENVPVGPPPENVVPQHTVLRDDAQVRKDAEPANNATF